MRPVLTKADMYSRLNTGEFGNTSRSWESIGSWFALADPQPQDTWGIRHTKVPGFPGSRLNVRTDDVVHTVMLGGFNGDYNISPMMAQEGRQVLWEGDVCLGPGLLCSGHANPAPGSWRTHMKNPRLWEGSAASVLLRSVLNENSHDDLMTLMDSYPDHVVELSALNVCFGTVPGRNAVIWEVRKY